MDEIFAEQLTGVDAAPRGVALRDDSLDGRVDLIDADGAGGLRWQENVAY